LRKTTTLLGAERIPGNVCVTKVPIVYARERTSYVRCTLHKNDSTSNHVAEAIEPGMSPGESARFVVLLGIDHFDCRDM
jgi:hypothetical protein